MKRRIHLKRGVSVRGRCWELWLPHSDFEFGWFVEEYPSLWRAVLGIVHGTKPRHYDIKRIGR